MSSDLQITNFLPGGLAAPQEDGSRASKAKIDQAWLRELERAQLEQLSAGNARNGGSNFERRSSGTTVQSERAENAGRPGPLEPELTRDSAGSGVAHAALQPRNSRSQGIAAMQRLVVRNEVQSGLPASGQKAVTIPKRSSAWEAAIELRLWGEARRWERRKAFVLEREGRVKVWLRDPDLESSPLEDVVASIGHLFREVGMEMEEITINGRIAFSSQSLDEQRGFRINYRD